ncbi:MAG: hypothetical protein EBV86_06740 [Marivivens sp.]|nr:hypothetical protein [Marivivens sp.]
MASIDNGPTGGSWIPAGQKLLFTLIPDEPVDDAYRYIVEVEENGTIISKVYLTPNPTNSVFFDLSEAISGRLEVDAFKYGQTGTIHSLNNKMFSRSNDNMKRYRLKVGHFDGSSENLADDTSGYYYLFDGYEQLSQGLFPSFSDYYGTASTKKVWLSDRVPTSDVINVKAAIEDNGVAAFINSDDTGSLITDIVFKIYDTSGSLEDTLTYVINSTNGGLVPTTAWSDSTNNGSLLYAYVYPASFTALTNALNGVVGGWDYYDVIPSTTTGPTGNTLRITNDCRYSKNEAVQLAWANTRGGWDYLRFNGKKQKTVTREEKTYRKIVGDYSGSQYQIGGSERQIKPYQLEAKERYQLNGILTIEELTLLQYCMRSKNVMARIDGIWAPVTISTNSMQVEEETVSKVFVTSFEVELAQIIRC